ncbi:hypothetical protein PIB30_001603 [Stylosanthes scabra]|uniref:Uncharacterized protein n=1 Tax=Stylosanthes scabra TaxID=79078 RepID=A0ABU6S2K3_9FABA|nr:hypothetical protein [Stylosanthes scabra]
MATHLSLPPVSPPSYHRRRETLSIVFNRVVIDGCRGSESSLVDNLRSAGFLGVRATEFSANLEQATQQAQEECDESAGTVDPNVVWRQTLSEPYRFTGLVASSPHLSADPATESLQSQGEVLQQQIDEVRSLKETLAERDARAKE